MKVVDIANIIYQNLGEPDDISIASVASKVRNMIGDLNLSLNTSFALNYLYDIVDENNIEINNNAIAILQKKYEIFYYSRKSNSLLGAAGVEVKVVQDDGASVTTYDKGALSKGYLEMKKVARAELQDLINGYRRNNYKPLDINGDDTISITANGIYGNYGNYPYERF